MTHAQAYSAAPQVQRSSSPHSWTSDVDRGIERCQQRLRPRSHDADRADARAAASRAATADLRTAPTARTCARIFRARRAPSATRTRRCEPAARIARTMPIARIVGCRAADQLLHELARLGSCAAAFASARSSSRSSSRSRQRVRNSARSSSLNRRPCRRRSHAGSASRSSRICAARAPRS